jgi:hypothetical protein
VHGPFIHPDQHTDLGKVRNRCVALQNVDVLEPFRGQQALLRGIEHRIGERHPLNKAGRFNHFCVRGQRVPLYLNDGNDRLLCQNRMAPGSEGDGSDENREILPHLSEPHRESWW